VSKTLKRRDKLFEVEGYRNTPPAAKQGKRKSRMEISDKMLLAGPPPITPAVDSSKFPFELLPPEIFQKILSCLCYRSLIAFSCTNRYLHNAVNPQTASQEDKRAFVRHAEMYFPQHFPIQDEDWPSQISENSTGNDRTGNFACYSCFRVRGFEHLL
jgi:hypothetical protein